MKKMDDEKRRQMILEGGIGKILITLAVPTLMMSLVQSLIPLSDGLFINNVAGTLVAGAVTFCNPVISLATALAVGLSAAAMAVIGQTFGRGDFSEVRRVSTQTVVFGFLLGLCIIPVMIILAFPVSAYVTPEISDNVRLYIILYAFVLPFSFMESIYNGIMNATGRPEKPFIRMVIMLVLKVVFNVVFIVWLRLGIAGCVLATFSANVAVCIWMFYELFLVKSSMQLTLKDVWLDDFHCRQYAIDGLMSGDRLYVVGEDPAVMLADEKGRIVLQFSKKFKQEYGKVLEEGYRMDSAEVNMIVWWKNENKEKEIKVLLPTLHFSIFSLIN